jgi:hypothetical protein
LRTTEAVAVALGAICGKGKPDRIGRSRGKGAVKGAGVGADKGAGVGAGEVDNEVVEDALVKAQTGAVAVNALRALLGIVAVEGLCKVRDTVYAAVIEASEGERYSIYSCNSSERK